MKTGESLNGLNSSETINALVAAQTQRFDQTGTVSDPSNPKGATFRVNSTVTVDSDVASDGGPVPGLSDATACEIVQQIVYEIATTCSDTHDHSYYKGTARSERGLGSAPQPVQTQFASVLEMILVTTTTKSEETNALTIDQKKVRIDLQLPDYDLDDPTITPWKSVPVENGPTTRLSELLSGYAFVPVLNRLIAGGGFSVGTTGAGSSGSDETTATDFSFDMNSGNTPGSATADGTGDLIHNDTYLVFPVRIMFADDGVTNREGSLSSALFYIDEKDGVPVKTKILRSGASMPFTTDEQLAADSTIDRHNWYYMYEANTSGTGTATFMKGVSYGKTVYKRVNYMQDRFILRSEEGIVGHTGPSVKESEGNISFQLNIIFGNRPGGADAVGSMT